MDAIKIISQNVGQTVSRIIENTDERLFENAREIRLFAGRPLRIVNGEEGFFIGRNGRKCEAGSAADRLSLREIRDTFAALCKYSVHTFEREIREGFITIEGGIRVGICGTAVYENGKIINISSVVGIYGNPGQFNYSATKAAIIGMTKTAAKELGSRNVRVNAVAPGFIITDMTAQLPEDVRKEWAAKIPLRRGGTPEDIADVCTFLASDMSRYVTGQVIHVCGGMNM